MANIGDSDSGQGLEGGDTSSSERHPTGLAALGTLVEALGGELSPAARSGLVDAVLAHTDDAIVLSKVDEMTGVWSASVIYVNTGFSTLTGYGADDVLGQSPAQWAPPERNRGLDDAFRSALEAGGAARGDVCVVTRSGETRWADTSISSIEGEGSAHYFLTTLRDISDRIELLGELAEQGEQLQAAQAIARVGSWAWDVIDDAVTWSEELYRIYGLDHATFGASFEAYLARVHPEDRQMARQTVENAVRTHRAFAEEYRIVRADGETRWLHSRGRVLLDESGSVVRVIGTCQDVSDQRAVEEDLRHQALHDELTGLPTRTLLADRLDHAVSRAQRHGLATLVLFIDLDNFKAVNDVFGHEAGDEALRSVAHNLREALRPGDTVARYGGDEFVALCEEVRDEEHALTLARRVLDAVAGAGMTTTREIRLSASVGVALSTDSQPASLVRNADAAMYSAKSRGAGCVEVYR